jgi:hypothetical protein
MCSFSSSIISETRHRRRQIGHGVVKLDVLHRVLKAADEEAALHLVTVWDVVLHADDSRLGHHGDGLLVGFNEDRIEGRFFDEDAEYGCDVVGFDTAVRGPVWC